LFESGKTEHHVHKLCDMALLLTDRQEGTTKP
jgi:hypothetical protein